MRTVAIHQPEFLPWLGFFHKLSQSDHFVFLDTAQYNKQDYQNRNRVMAEGNCHWISVPLVKHGSKTPIRDIEICNQTDWASKIERQLYHFYHTSPFYGQIQRLIEPLWVKPWFCLADLNIYLIKQVMTYLHIETETHLASELLYGQAGYDILNATEKNMALCVLLRADRYLSGNYGRHYLNEPQFAQQAIEVSYTAFRPETINLSILHHLFRHGPDTKAML